MNITINIPEQKVVDALISACESGSYYWARTSGYPYDRKGEKLTLPIAVVEHMDGEKKEKVHRLDEGAVRSGLKLMAEKYPAHFADLLNGGDWITGDVLLQLSTLGELKYG